MDSFALCTCYSGALFKTCCEPYLGHTVVPDTAEALMRSRFSAFQFKDAVYLKETWDSKTRPLHLNFEKDERFWSSLEVVSKTGGGPSDERGVIEFKAKYELGEDTYLFHEVSRFIRRDARWLYLDATFPFHGKVAHQGEWLKNAPCLCGRGKKFKKCCG